jgi:hypothetical protein
MTNKCVQEFELKFYNTYLDALMDEKYLLKIIEVENNTLPSSITIEINGNLENFRLKPFKRQNERGTFLENVYLKIS